MTNETTQAAVEVTESAVAVEATPAKKTAPKKVAKKAAKKAPAKAAKKTEVKGKKTPAKKATKAAPAAKAEKNGKAPKVEGLAKPQVRILQLLSKGQELTRAEIAEKAPVDNAFCTTWIGSLDPAKREANEQKRGIKSLLTLKHVIAKQYDVNGKDVTYYSITPAGKKAIS